MEADNHPYTIKQWPRGDRPREKLLAKGKEALSDAELVALLLGSGFKDQTAVDVARKLLSSVDNDLNNLAVLSVSQLSRTKGIGKVKAISIAAALELGRRQKAAISANTNITCSKDAWEYMYPYLADLDYERLYILMLDNAGHALKTELIGSGGIGEISVDIKLLFRKVFENLKAMPSKIILCHNHPSGNLQPSQKDLDITQKIIAAGKLLDIHICDHIIFTNKGYYSLADEGNI